MGTHEIRTATRARAGSRPPSRCAYRWLRTALLNALLALATGCGAKYNLRTDQPAIALQWPYQPNPAKLRYVQSFSGLARQANSASALKNIVLGIDPEDPDAFALPVAVATGADGRLAVADLGRRCVHLHVPDRQQYTRLSASKEIPMVSPVGLAFDEDLRLYVSDSSGRIFVFGADGALLFEWRLAGSEALQRPTGLAYSPSKHLLYVVDTVANRVHALRPDGTRAFSFGERGDGEGQFNFPTHIARAVSGELYVTDSLNFRIAIFSEEGKPLGVFGHHGDGSGDLAMSKGVAVDKDGVVYVVDGLFDHVQLFDRDGRFLLTVGNRGTTFGEFWLPAGAFISTNDELYVCDTYNRRVQVFRITGGYANATH